MNTDSCPIPTPQERSFLAIQQAAEQTMLEKVSRAISDATAEVTRNVQDTGLEFEPTSEGYFMFAVQQATFVRLCGGNADTLREETRRLANMSFGTVAKSLTPIGRATQHRPRCPEKHFLSQAIGHSNKRGPS